MQSLSGDPKTVASLLHSKGFVSDRLLEEVTDLNVTRSDNIMDRSCTWPYWMWLSPFQTDTLTLSRCWQRIHISIRTS